MKFQHIAIVYFVVVCCGYTVAAKLGKDPNSTMPYICNQTNFNQFISSGEIPSASYIKDIETKCGKLYEQCGLKTAYPYASIIKGQDGIVLGVTNMNNEYTTGCWGYYLTVLSSNGVLVFKRFYPHNSMEHGMSRHILNFTDNLLNQSLLIQLFEFPSGEEYPTAFSLPKNACQREARLQASKFFWGSRTNSNTSTCTTYQNENNLQAVAERYCKHFKDPSIEFVANNMKSTLEIDHCTVAFNRPTEKLPGEKSAGLFTEMQVVLIATSSSTLTILLILMVVVLRRHFVKAREVTRETHIRPHMLMININEA